MSAGGPGVAEGGSSRERKKSENVGRGMSNLSSHHRLQYSYKDSSTKPHPAVCVKIDTTQTCSHTFKGQNLTIRQTERTLQPGVI